MFSGYQYFIAALFALAMMAVTSVSAGKGSIEFFDLPQEGWHAGDNVSFRIKIEKEKHAAEFLGEKGNVSVVFERSRFGSNKKFELEDMSIAPIEEDPLLFAVSGVVPQVDKKAKYTIKIQRKRSLWFGKKTMAKSDYNRLKVWRMFGESARRKVTIDPQPAVFPVDQDMLEVYDDNLESSK